ncbi:beta-galactosidase [Auraticoccus sp. F435]|uniref:Beta-galactosidase n=1 Tax=Auraticoccus cholistanensis TaxID=2656650 RepID=A0A6A9UU52_9ACTN|nr:beta-galactosidase [Auraticoccus cholistanensis]MVA75182.1 beta-galactosidase [Auraticoccus cholistanensis]
MSNDVETHTRVRLTSRWLEVDGARCIPVSGELHYSRVPRRRWEEELRLLVASGITMVSTYVFWIHHEREQGRVRFDGDLDVAEFIVTADRVGIDVVLRIGPWAHGESRNGGLPDWVLATAPSTRQDDPTYLALVQRWFERLGEQVGHHCGPDGRVVAIQLENELYDQPTHITTLKRLARGAGLSAPLWTATAWGGALLPPHEVLPVYSGYADGFWADQGSGWDDSFRDHFTFSHRWDDPGVGADQRAAGLEVVVRDLDPEFPPATCELGGGMATAYHRRPVARGEDIAAVANVKLGNGSVWQGFYMYAGGTNPEDHLQESHATGYPCDLPRFDYDFQAALGATGLPGPGMAALREHNAFVGAFGDRLADMGSTLPDGAPVDVHDLATLRWAVRSDGRSGFLFINTHQPHQPLSGHTDVQLRVGLDEEELLVPDQPVDLPSGLVARWPLQLDIEGVRLQWATASVVGLVPGAPPTLVLRAEAGVPARLLLAPGSTGELDGRQVALGMTPLELLPGGVLVVDGRLRILLVDGEQVGRLWFLDGQLVDSVHPVWSDRGRLTARAAEQPAVARWSGRCFEPVALTPTGHPVLRPVQVTRVREPSDPPARYGHHAGRSSAPSDEQLDAVAGVWQLPPLHPGDVGPGALLELLVRWEGDVAQLRADGVPVADRFWDGREWRIDITALPPQAVLTLHVAPLTTRTVVDLDPVAEARRREAAVLCAVLGVELVGSVLWQETGRGGADGSGAGEPAQETSASSADQVRQ